MSDVLVTGADGFVGSHLVEALLTVGHNVTAVVRRTSRSQLTRDYPNLAECLDDRRLTVVPVDLAGSSALVTLICYSADTWMHLAADAYVPASLAQPASVIQNNVMSTVNVLEAARVAETNSVVIASSCEVYGESRDPITEATGLEPSTPYAASKAAADRIAWSYWRTFGLPVTIVRPFNCYGPRHVYDVIPIFIAAALKGIPLSINGDGSQSRDFTYISDLVNALMLVAERPMPGEVYNIGTGVDTTIRDLADQVLEAAGVEGELQFGPPRPGDPRRLCADASKIHDELGWTPSVTLEAGLRLNIDWFRSLAA